jgi:hypothetical protein
MEEKPSQYSYMYMCVCVCVFGFSEQRLENPQFGFIRVEKLVERAERKEFEFHFTV